MRFDNLFRKRTVGAQTPDATAPAKEPAPRHMTRQEYAQTQRRAFEMEEKLREMANADRIRILCDGQTREQLFERIGRFRFYASLLYYENSEALRRAVADMQRYLRQMDAPGSFRGCLRATDARRAEEGEALEFLVHVSGEKGQTVCRWDAVLPEQVDRVFAVTTSDDPYAESACVEIYAGDACYVFPRSAEHFDRLTAALDGALPVDWALFAHAMGCMEESDFLVYRRTENEDEPYDTDEKDGSDNG